MRVHSIVFGDQLFGLHWSFEFISQVFGSYLKGCQRVYLWDLFGFCSQGLDLQQFWSLGLIKHGIIGSVNDDGRR